jgi:hypothetical protein
MILTPYQTRAGSVYDTVQILNEIKKAEALDSEVTSPRLAGDATNGQLYFVTQMMPDVPGFVHPIIEMDDSSQSVKHAHRVFVDARPYATRKPDGLWHMRSENDFDALIRRATLSLLWAEGDVTDFLAMGEMPLKLYLNWVGNTAGRHLAIDPLTQFRVSALAGMFYLSSHYENDQLKEEKYQVKMADKVARAMRGSLDEVLGLVSGYPPLNSLEAFVEALQTRVGSVRLENISIAYLFNVVGGSWFGNNARETTAMALDHVPTWIGLLFQAMNDRSMRKAGLSQLVNTLTRAQEHKDFTRSVELLLKG